MVREGVTRSFLAVALSGRDVQWLFSEGGGLVDVLGRKDVKLCFA